MQDGRTCWAHQSALRIQKPARRGRFSDHVFRTHEDMIAKHDCAPSSQEFALSDEKVHTCSTSFAAKKGDKYGPAFGSQHVADRDRFRSPRRAGREGPGPAASLSQLADRGDVPVDRVARPLPELG